MSLTFSENYDENVRKFDKLFGIGKNHIDEMTLKGAFFYHYYENFYTLSYIDKMWGVLRNEAFPEKIEL